MIASRVVSLVSRSVMVLALTGFVVVGMLVTPVEATLCVAALAFGVALPACVMPWAARGDASGGHARARVTRGRAVGLIGSALTGGIVGLIGMDAVLGPATGPVIAALVLMAAALGLARWLRPRARPPVCTVRTTPPPAPASPDVPRPRAPGLDSPARGADPPAADRGIAALSLDELCRAWQQSWLLLLDEASDPIRWARLAETRRRYLAELERIDPGGVARWLADGPRAGGDPSKYFTPSAGDIPGDGHEKPNHQDRLAGP